MNLWADLRSACEFARDWVVWTFTGWQAGCQIGVYRWWDVREYFASSLRVCRTLMLAREILRD